MSALESCRRVRKLHHIPLRPPARFRRWQTMFLQPTSPVLSPKAFGPSQKNTTHAHRYTHTHTHRAQMILFYKAQNETSVVTLMPKTLSQTVCTHSPFTARGSKSPKITPLAVGNNNFSRISTPVKFPFLRAFCLCQRVPFLESFFYYRVPFLESFLHYRVPFLRAFLHFRGNSCWKTQEGLRLSDRPSISTVC